MRDVGGLARPRRQRAEARDHDECLPAFVVGGGRPFAVGEQRVELRALRFVERTRRGDPVDVSRGQRSDRDAFGGQSSDDPLDAEVAERRAAVEAKDVQARVGRATHRVRSGPEGKRAIISGRVARLDLRLAP